jgi:hypothetical protein
MSTAMRSFSTILFEEMPSFDLVSELARDSADTDRLRGGYRFAYKFVTDYNRFNSGSTFTLSDGTTVWRLGIRSAGALSINIFFSEYNLPEGARVYIFDPAQRIVLGSFNHLNNSEAGVLPVAPLEGDELIIEYQEPASASFPGRLTVGEVNHAYRPLRGAEPSGNYSNFSCMPSPVCIEGRAGLDSIQRSVLLMIIDGVTACTGVLVNNSASDGKPYVMTASHCLNNNFMIKNPDYVKVAASIVSFFNYSSPTCDTVRRGAEEMSVASAQFRAVNTDYDLALLELYETPPPYYRPFYSGWSRDENGGRPPYVGIHHPKSSVKRVNLVTNEISLISFGQYFLPNGHWLVERYDEGCTDRGSSGSPLFDSTNSVIGLLSGGESTCDTPENDLFYAFFKAWAPSDNANEQLKCWLAPGDAVDETFFVKGLDPYESNPCYRLSNILENKLNDSIEVTNIQGSGRMFGINSITAAEYVEEYYANSKASVEGLYLVVPAIDDNANELKVEVVIYNSNAGKPATLLYTGIFSPAYKNLSTTSGVFVETPRPLQRSQEVFVRIDEKVTVEGTFFVGYRIVSPANSTFAVYNLRKGQSAENTAWVKHNNNWVAAKSHPAMPFATALFIDPVIRFHTGVDVKSVADNAAADIFSDLGRRNIYINIYDGKISAAVFSLYSADGRMLLRKEINNSAHIPVDFLNSGIYIGSLQWRGGSLSRKIVL